MRQAQGHDVPDSIHPTFSQRPSARCSTASRTAGSRRVLCVIEDARSGLSAPIRSCWSAKRGGAGGSTAARATGL